MSAAEAPEAASRTKIPAAPFVGNTSAWTALAIKRIAKMAADEGYDRVAFINGEQSAARYDLSKQVSRIEYHENLNPKLAGTVNAFDHGGDLVIDRRATPEELPDLIGKEVADRLLKQTPDNGGARVISGLDLKVGGEGMKAFYDKIVPNVAKDVVRRLGGDGLHNEVGFNIPNEEGTFRRSKQIGFDITDKMREQTAGGVPLFRHGEATRPVGTPERMEQVLRDKFGDKLVQGLLDQGVLKMMLSADDTVTPVGPRTRAVFRQGERIKPNATMYVDRVSAKDAPGILMHELGEHFGIQRVHGNERYALMLSELREMRNDSEVRGVWRTVKANYKNLAETDPTFLREVAAHLVEEHPDLPFVRRLVNEIRAFFYEHFGTTLGNRVDANLIRGLAASALRKASKGDLPNMRRYVRFDGTPIPPARPGSKGGAPRPMLQ